MNREIKFRAWDGKKWQYGTYYYGVMYPTSFMGHYVNDEQIDENTLGQFTGLTDKNGKEIFEGDIIPDTKGKPRTVYFENGVFMWGDEFLGFDDLQPYPTEEWAEIIGNIYENPELIQK